MNKLTLLTLLTFISFTISSQVSAKKYIDFIPIPPVQIKNLVLSTSANNKIVNLSTTQMSLDKQAVLNFVPNESMETTIQKFNNEGNIEYYYSGRSVNKGSYRLIIDYNKYIIHNIDKTGQEDCQGYAKIGIGLRIIANIKALKNNIDISSLVAIGNAAKDGNISGTVGYQVIGIESKEITAILPINSEITSSINQIFLQAIGVVKGKIYDEKTRLHPQIIALKHTGCEINVVLKNLMAQYTVNK
ncbi:hypothetical protein [uncultured Polaribacter sp.]|uniref:hypothetical protein n=1 Tax=uncultured Polaribacter sp. TaxID=174711 RepID=UPI00262278FD|nr:hypothetical protein [uncultured Polaribacter sp.]